MSALFVGDFWFGALTLAGIYAIFALGIQMNVGFTGITNLGHSGFMAVGGYTAALLSLEGWDFAAAVAVAIVATVVFAVLLGLPSLRLPDDYFAIVTVAAASIVIILAQNLRGLTGGNDGLSGFDSTWVSLRSRFLDWLGTVGLGTEFALPLLIVTWASFAALAVTLILLQRTPWGRSLRAVREDEEAAASLGKNVLVLKLQSLGVAGVCSAVAGCLVALNLSVVYPGSFNLDVMFIGTAILMLGGLGSYLGVAYGAVLMWVVLELARFADLPLSSDRVAAIRMLMVGVVLMVMAMFRPQGLFGNDEEMVLRD